MSSPSEFWGPRPRRVGLALFAAGVAVAATAALAPSTLMAVEQQFQSVPVLVPAAPNPTPSVPSTTPTSPSRESMAATAGTVGDLATGVVLINTTMTNGSAAGTGMVLTADGQVLTNYHVVAGSTEIEVTVATTGRTYQATVVGHDASHDVALLQLNGASNLATVTVDDDDVTSGPVTAVGNASGQGFLTEAAGEITDTNTTISVADELSNSRRTMTGLIETTAEAVPGDSGGPMYDSEGEVVGITTAGTSESSGRGSQSGVTTASYAVTIDTATEIVDQIRRGEESGTVEIGPRAYLGVVIADDGTLAQVVPGSAADQAGLVEGDQITAIGDRQIGAVDDISQALGELNPGEVVQVDWTTANGQQDSAQVTLGESPVN